MTAIGDTSEVLFPAWSARVPSPKPSGRFPLGLEAVGSAMVAEHVFPALTNATGQARYFSFLCWVFWTFDQYRRASVSAARLPAAQFAWRVRLEHAFRCCSQLHALSDTQRSAPGLIGVRATPDLRDADEDVVVPLATKRISKIASAFDPENYGSPFVALGLGVPEDDRIKLNAIGVEAGQAFDAGLRHGMTREVRAALGILLDGRARVSVQTLRLLSARLRLRAVLPGEAEHDVLLRVLFRLQSKDRQQPPLDVDDRRRARGLTHILELVGQSRGTIEAPRDCHAVFATGAFSDGRSLSVDSCLEYPAGVWRRYEERQHQKTAIGAFWHETLEFLESEDAPPQPPAVIVAKFLTLLQRSPVLQRWLGASALDRTVGDATGAIAKSVKRSGADPMTVGVELATAIRDVTDPDATKRLGAALVLLLLSVATWRTTAIAPQFAAMHERGGPGRLTLPWMARELERRGDQSLRELVKWVTEWCVLAQAVRVAYEKTGTSSRSNRFFIERVDGGYRIVRLQPLNGRLSFDASRLRGSFSLLTSLGLLLKETDDEPYALSADGRRLIRATREALPTSEA